jgi:hypothetical protein
LCGRQFQKALKQQRGAVNLRPKVRLAVFKFRSALLFSILLGVCLTSFFRVRSSVRRMTAGGMGVMRCLFVMARIVVLGRLLMMLGCMAMMLRRLLVVFGSLLGH